MLSQLDSLRRSLEGATESLRLTNLRYEAGEVSVLEVVDAQATLAQARNAYDDGLCALSPGARHSPDAYRNHVTYAELS